MSPDPCTMVPLLRELVSQPVGSSIGPRIKQNSISEGRNAKNKHVANSLDLRKSQESSTVQWRENNLLVREVMDASRTGLEEYTRTIINI
jgi:hypothetical protein